MKVTPADRAAAAEAVVAKQATKKAMPQKVASLLARGRCQDCALPWDCVGVGSHVPIDQIDWVCGRCFIFRETGVSLVLGYTKSTEFRGRCANNACGSAKDEKNRRIRARVLKVGDFCSKACESLVKGAQKQKTRVKTQVQKKA